MCGEVWDRGYAYQQARTSTSWHSKAARPIPDPQDRASTGMGLDTGCVCGSVCEVLSLLQIFGPSGALGVTSGTASARSVTNLGSRKRRLF